VLLHFRFFLRLLRYANRAFVLNWYAVMTKRYRGSGPRTYITRRYRPAAVWPIATRDPSRPGRSSLGFDSTSSTSSSATAEYWCGTAPISFSILLPSSVMASGCFADHAYEKISLGIDLIKRNMSLRRKIVLVSTNSYPPSPAQKGCGFNRFWQTRTLTCSKVISKTIPYPQTDYW